MTKSKRRRVSKAGPVEGIELLDERLSRPSPTLIEAMRDIEGDILILGVGGKMGPSLAEMAVRATREAGVKRQIIGVSGFSQKALRQELEAAGVRCIAGDLLKPGVLRSLPDVPNVIYMIGRKFGSTGAEWHTWNTNVYLAGKTARRYKNSKIVAFSSGNVYPLVPVASGGCTEETPLAPVGEYAMTGLGRERMFDLVSHEHKTRVVHLRLNYANELRYGIIHDVASKVWRKQPIDLTMGHVNVVWQGYANSVAIQCLRLASSPPAVINVAGPETVSIRWLAERLGSIMKRVPKFTGVEAETALLSNAAKCFSHFGYPDVPLDTLIDWVAHWIMRGGASLGKPTHYATRDGKF